MTIPPAPVPDDQWTVYVYRSTDAGATWQRVTVIASAEGFARNGAPDSYQMVANPPRDPDNVAMLGMAGWNGTESVQQFVWMSNDGGLTWLKNPNWGVPYFNGDWQVGGPGGLTAFPGTRPVLLAGARAPQATIVG
jgi:hypothetical protein